MFGAQDRMVGEIVRTLAPKVRNEELRRIRIKAPENMVAYALMSEWHSLRVGENWSPDRAAD